MIVVVEHNTSKGWQVVFEAKFAAIGDSEWEEAVRRYDQLLFAEDCPGCRFTVERSVPA